MANQDLPLIANVSDGGGWAGTAWPVDGQGDFITCYHVVYGNSSLYLVSPRTGQSWKATVVNVDPGADIAELHVAVLDEAPLALDREVVPVAEPVVDLASGYATGKPAVTFASIAAVDVNESGPAEQAVDDYPNENLAYTDMIEVGATAYAGNSGGPLLNAAGEVVGIIALGGQQSSTAYAIPVSVVGPEIQDWLAGVGSGN